MIINFGVCMCVYCTFLKSTGIVEFNFHKNIFYFFHSQFFLNFLLKFLKYFSIFPSFCFEKYQSTPIPTTHFFTFSQQKKKIIFFFLWLFSHRKLRNWKKFFFTLKSSIGILNLSQKYKKKSFLKLFHDALF